MNPDSIRARLSRTLANVTEVEPSVFRAERQHNEQTHSVYYVDCSGAPCRPDFDVREWTSKSLASDYYRNPGSLQWNYYLYFVLDSSDRIALTQQGRVGAIEADCTFARKYVLDEDSLDRELSAPSAPMLGSTEPIQDVASRWVGELTAAGLGGIADPDRNYAPIVREYLNNVHAPSTPPLSNEVEQTDVGRFLRSMKLLTFRTYPIQREYGFAQINLFRGVNGTGKTSLLEAIELSLCGGIRRQNGAVPTGAHLEAHFDGDVAPRVCPEQDPAIYRARDRAWFGGYYLQGNRLWQNFGRFNFFDTDAAVRLSDAPTAKDIAAALDTLLLGELAKIVEERMRQMSERFGSELRTCQKQLSSFRKQLETARETLEALGQAKDTRSALILELQTAASACGWPPMSSELTLSDIATVRERATKSVDELTAATLRTPWVARPSLKTLRAEETRLGIALADFRRIDALRQQSEAQMKAEESRLGKLNDELALLRRLLEYYTATDAPALMDRHARIAQLKLSIQQLAEADAAIRTLTLEDLATHSQSWTHYVDSARSSVKQLEATVSSLRIRASQVQSLVGELQALVAQIKGLGTRFCQLDADADHCPLCETQIADLRTRIGQPARRAFSDPQLATLTAEIQRCESILEVAREESNALQEATRLVRHVAGAPNPDDVSTGAFSVWLSTVRDRRAASEEELAIETETERQLQNAGFTSEEFRQLVDQLSLSRGPQPPPSTAASLEADIQELEELQKQAVANLVGYRASCDEWSNAIEKLQEDFIGHRSLNSLPFELERRLGVVRDVPTGLASALPLLGDGSVEFESAASKLSTFVGVATRIHDAIRSMDERGAVEQRLTTEIYETNKQISELSSLEGRAQSAVALIEKLLGDEYKGAYRNNLAATHRDTLNSVLRRIHSPHEFEALHMDGTIWLERIGGLRSEVSEISTGQRTALALTIFLGLNTGASRRAPWILLDDPIAHIDDLNVLSFLDTLRDLALLGGRQIFFATANDRLADLFLRKFDCMGDELKEFRLNR